MKIAIIMPAYNAEKYISHSIISVINQTFSNWELIIVDDGSTDETYSIVSSFLYDKRIKYFFQPNQGQANARNKAIRETDADFIAFLDADDSWIKNKLEIQVNFILKNNCEIVCSHSFIMDDKEIVLLDKLKLNYDSLSGIEGFKKIVYANSFVPILTVMVSRNIINKIGFFDESKNIRCAEDFDYWLRILHAGFTIYTIPLYLTFYRKHEHQSTSKDVTSALEVIEVLKKYINTNNTILINIICKIGIHKRKIYNLEIKSNNAFLIKSCKRKLHNVLFLKIPILILKFKNKILTNYPGA